MGAVMRGLAFPHPPREESKAALLREAPLQLTTAHGGKKGSAGTTPALHVQRAGAPFTLLYTHGNAEDIGQLVKALKAMSQHCGASVFAVEYPGYSISEAEKPSERLCHEAAEAAFRYLTEELGQPPGSVVPFGRSLGTGPATFLAARHPEIRGLVLQSPLESGARAVFGRAVGYAGYPFDIFKNYRMIGSVEAMTCVIHGTIDEVVPCDNGRYLHAVQERRKKAAIPLWIQGHGHNDLPHDRVWLHVKNFLETLEAP